MKVETEAQLANRRRLIEERKLRLKAEGRCVDCKNPTGGGSVRCLKCRVKQSDREKRRHASLRAQRCPKKPITRVEQAKTVQVGPSPIQIRNAQMLVTELQFDDGLDAGLRRELIEVIGRWKKNATVTEAA